MRKVLWVVECGDVAGFVRKADLVRAQAVCVRTTNPWLKGQIKALKKHGLDVYAWRWPSVDPAASSRHHYADDEAQFALELISEGLDGYIVDPEADDGRASDNWNDAKWANLAASFCETIKLAGLKSNPHFLFGTTSGCDYPTIKPDIPYATFFAYSDAVYPQIYWAPDLKKAHRTNPDDAWTIGMKSWKKVTPAHMRVVPILGEIERNAPAEITRFGEIMAENNLTDEVHFYTFADNMTDAKFDAQWDALRALGTTPLIA